MESFDVDRKDRQSADWQLDALLAELEQLGSALDSPNMAEQLLLGMATLPAKATREPLPSSASTQSANLAVASTCSSPDGDSAFGEGGSSSSEGKEQCRHSAVSSDSCAQSLHTPSPSQVSPGSRSAEAEDDSKEAKIRQALLKMREANHTRIFVKLFVEDGPPMQMLVDERWTVAETMRQLAEKHHMTLCEDHCIVEEFPELFIRRIYEDDENLVENIQMWVEGSPNKLLLTRRPEKYSWLDRPEVFLLTERSAESVDVPRGEHWPLEVKKNFLHEFFSREPFVPPELEGWLHLKGDGKKVWKKCYFVLRTSGLYYSPKGKKTTKDLQCLMNFHSNQVYTGFDWRKKYKAPSEFGLSLKLTQLQMKRSSYIKYICAEDELTYKKWLVALRVAKNGRQIYDNYVAATERRMATMAAAAPRRVDVPRVERTASQASQRRADAVSLSSSSSRHDVSAPSSSASSRLLRLECSSPHSEPALSASLASRLRDYDQQPTGTIKRAPAEVTDVIRRSASSCVEEEDSDEESFPAPPPLASPAPSLSRSPVPPPKPPLLLSSPVSTGPPPPPVRHTPIRDEYAVIEKRVPPPPPKRSDGTRLTAQSPAVPHLSELEAALDRRRQKIGHAN